MDLLTRVFSDNLVNPSSLDYTDGSWSYPIKTWDMSNIALGTGDKITGAYKSKPAAVRDVITSYPTPALDLVIYLHGVSGSAQGGVRVLCWKTGVPINTGSNKRVWVPRGAQAMLDCIPGPISGTVGAAVFSLRVLEVPDTLQLLVSQDCQGASMYLRNPERTLRKNPSFFIQTEGLQ